MKKSARQIAFEILMKIERDNAYSNLTLDSMLDSSALDTRDKSFVSALVYGIIERRLTIDYQLEQYLTKPLKKLKPEVIVILRIGAYQLLFMDKVPVSAAVNESVKMTKANKSAYASSIVNAVLRKISKNGLILPDSSNLEEYLCIKYSCPVWLIKKWNAEYGADNTTQLLSASVETSETVIKVNTLKTDCESLKNELVSAGIGCQDGYIKDSLKISLSGADIEELDAFKKGLFHVQDTASTLCATALYAQENDTVFDLCAAPGGKAFTVAELMNGKGRIVAFDLYAHRTGLIASGAKRLGIDIIEAQIGDASEYNEELGKADKVLCDVPCSGLGIIRRKPEIKYKSQESLESLPDIQLKILCNASRYVKDGGRLIYSTCTLNKDENENVCKKFLEISKDFESVKPLPNVSQENFVTLMPHKNNTDGFFIAAFERKGNKNA